MAIPSGSYRVTLGDTTLKPFPPKPPQSRKTEVNNLISASLSAASSSLSDAQIMALGLALTNQAAGSGSIRVPMGDFRPKPFSPKPPTSKRKEIYAIVEESFSNIGRDTVLTADLIETIADDLAKITFNNYQFVDGRLVPSRIRETYLYINGVYVKKSKYKVYEEGNNLIVQTTSFIGYAIASHWHVVLRIRTVAV